MAPIIRILMRYLSAFLIAKGYFGEGDAGLFMDEELIGFIVAAMSEGWYALAKIKKWSR